MDAGGATAAPGLMSVMDVPRVKTGRGEAPLQWRSLQTHQVTPQGPCPQNCQEPGRRARLWERCSPAQHHGAP